MHTEFYMSGFVPLTRGRLNSFRAQDEAEDLSLVDPGISRGVADLYPSRGYTPRKTRDRSIKRSLQS